MRRIWWFAAALAGCSNAVEMLTEGGTTGGGPSGSETGLPATTAEGVTTSAGSDESGTPGTAPTTSTTLEPTSEPTGPVGTTAATEESVGTSGEVGESGESSGGSTTGAPGEGCGQDPGFAGVQDRMIVVDGTDRHYIVVLPAGYDPALPTPLVFAWHGLGGNSTLARQYFGIEEASQDQAIFIYPDGLPQPELMNQTGWNLAPEGEDVAFFDAMLADAAATLCVDAGRVFSAGHSFGGYMSNELGCVRGGVVRAIGLVAGGGPYGQCSGQVAAWLAHGTLDAVVPYMIGEMSRDHWTDANSCDAQADAVDPAPCVAYTGCDEAFPVHWCSHDEPDFQGHGWPSWAGSGIWSFFAGF